MRERYKMILFIPLFWLAAAFKFLYLWVLNRDIKAAWKDFVDIHKWAWRN